MTENDFRFDWLQNTLLPYFSNWKHNILQRPGNFTASAKGKSLFLNKTMRVCKLHVILLLKPPNIC